MRWQGSKSKHLKHILPLVPTNFNTYIEPFVGSGALFLHLQPNQWIINDINTDLINLWNLVKTSPQYMISKLKYYNQKLEHLSPDEKLKYCRKKTLEIPKKPYGPSRTILWLVMIFCAYMGYIVNNGKYYFNGLEGKLYYEKSLYFVKDKYFKTLRSVHEYLNSSNGIIHNEDYTKILKLAKKDDFVFLDPPYIEDYNYKFNYNIGETIDKRFMYSLRDELRKLDNKGVKWLMTQANTPEVRTLFKGYIIHEFPVYRIRLKKYKTELIIKNY